MILEEEQRKYIVMLSTSERLHRKIKKFKHITDLKYFWDKATLNDFKSLRLTEEDFKEFQELRKKDTEALNKKIKENNIKYILFDDLNYPAILKEIADPPQILYIRGDFRYDEDRGLAIVGTRKPTRYGTDVTLNFSESIAKEGICIISGLAVGIDTLSHKGALNAKGKTIAVLGSGIDDKSIYPSSNRNLAHQIIDGGGAVISEYPPDYPISRYTFPERNRIISGLSKGVLVVEAKIKSGALITADFAVEQNKEVYAVLGDITRKESEGPNSLIKNGAKPALNPFDILEDYGILENEKKVISADNPKEEKIIGALLNGNQHIDDIIKITGLTVKETSSTLSLMEIKGKLINLGAQIFALKK